MVRQTRQARVNMAVHKDFFSKLEFWARSTTKDYIRADPKDMTDSPQPSPVYQTYQGRQRHQRNSYQGWSPRSRVRTNQAQLTVHAASNIIEVVIKHEDPGFGLGFGLTKPNSLYMLWLSTPLYK